jgi:hypothetical protein
MGALAPLAGDPHAGGAAAASHVFVGSWHGTPRLSPLLAVCLHSAPQNKCPCPWQPGKGREHVCSTLPRHYVQEHTSKGVGCDTAVVRRTAIPQALLQK